MSMQTGLNRPLVSHTCEYRGYHVGINCQLALYSVLIVIFQHIEVGSQDLKSQNNDNKLLWCLKFVNPTSGPKTALVIFLSAEWRHAQREEGRVVTQALGLCHWVAC